MATLHIYRGIQGSGKTTLAEKNAFLDQGRVVGRDHIRRLIGVKGLGTRAQEQEVTAIQGRLMAQGLGSGQNVHVDDMNLKADYVKRLLFVADKHNAEVEVHDLTYVGREICVLRDAARSHNQIGAEMIRSNWERFIKPLKGRPLPVPTIGSYDARLAVPEVYVPDTTKPKAVLIDLDGTTALKGDQRGYHDYDERVLFDRPNENVITVVRAILNSGITPVYVSGRKGNERCKNATRLWIQKHIRTGAEHLFMREPHDNRPDYIVKREIFDAEIRNKWNVVAAVDDRDQVVRMYRDLGLTVLQVADGNF